MLKPGAMTLEGLLGSHKPFLPEVPAVSETLPGYISVTCFGLVAPPKTPAATERSSCRR